MKTWLRTWLAGSLEECKHIGRNPSILLILVAIPVVYPTLLSWLYAQNAATERPAVIVDHDASVLSRKLLLSLDATQGISVVGRVDDLEQGFEMVRQRQAEMLLFIPEDFTSQIKSGRQASVKVWIDSANILTYGSALAATRETIGTMNEQLGRDYLHQQGLTPRLADRRIMPIQTDTRLLFHPTGAYGEFLITGAFLIVFQQLILISLSFSMGLRKELTPISPRLRFPFARLAGRVAAHSLLYLLAIVFIVLVVTPSFGWRIQSSMAVFVLYVVFGLTMFPLAMIAASLVKSRYTGFQVLMFLSTPVFMMSGFTWPLDQMPRTIQLLASAFPATPALLAMRTLAVKSGSFSAIRTELAWMAAQFIAYTLVAIALLHGQERRKLLNSNEINRELAGGDEPGTASQTA